LGWSYYHLSQVFVLKDDFVQAEQFARQSLKAWTSTGGRIGVVRSVLGHYRLGEILHWSGRTDEARSHFLQASEISQQPSEALPDEPYCQTWRILLFANCPDEAFRDPKLAVQLADRVITESNASLWRLLALSQYRRGACSDAKESLQKSMQLREGGDAADWLVLAMAYFQMGDRLQANQWHGRAQEAISAGKQVQYGDIGVLGFRRLLAEAETTLTNPDATKTLDSKSPNAGF
jgi:tetratricopeptide (TPR) repeat protein